MVGFLSVLFCTWLSDKYKMRGPIMIVACSIAIIGYIMLLASNRAAVKYGGYGDLYPFALDVLLIWGSTFLIAAGWCSKSYPTHSSATQLYLIHNVLHRNIPVLSGCNGLVSSFQPWLCAAASHHFLGWPTTSLHTILALLALASK